MSQEASRSLNASGGALLRTLSRQVSEQRRLLQMPAQKEEAYFVDYIPPARDAITLPRNVVYVLVGVVLVLVATYAIVGHLIKDLMHDLADWILGPKPVEDDLEEGEVELEEELQLSRGSVSCLLMEREKLRMKKEKDGLLPGFHLDPPPPPPPC